MNRAQRRKLAKGKKKKQKDVGGIMDLFDKLPDNCMICDTPYDKKDKEMVRTWNVVVREKQGVVNLYCPACWNRANKIIEEYKNRDA